MFTRSGKVRISKEKMIIKFFFFGKSTGHNDHYMINMVDQRLKIGGNWPLTYWQH